MARNRNLILQATRAGAQASVQLNEDGTLGADAILREAAESAARDADEKVELDKILDLCHDESEELEREQKSLSRLAQGNPSEEDKLTMGCDMDMVYNGEHVKSGRLPDGTVNPLGVRARNLIGRTRLLQMLKDRKFRDDPNASPNADAEIKKYREAAERLLVVNDGKAAVDEDVLAELGEKMKYFQADTEVVLDESGKPIRRSIPGWEIGREGASYGFKEVENAGAIDWSDPMNAVAVMNNTLGKMMQDSETREQADMFGAREMGVGEDEITKPLFLELCDIFIDMMCGVRSHITAPGYATPRSPSRNIDLILKSGRVESRVKADGRIKEAKVEYNPEDAKMTEFFNMLATRSEKFRGYVGGIVGQEVVGCIGSRFTVISGVEGFHGRQDMVCIAPTKTYSTYTLYKNTTTFTLEEYNRLLKSNSLPKAMCAGGDRFCYLAMLDDKGRGPGDSYMCNVQFVGTSHGMAMDEMADRLANLLVPYILKYSEISGQLEKGAKLGNFSDNPAEYVFNAFQAAEREVGKFVQEKFDLSQAQIRGDQIEKERLMTEIKDMTEKFGEKYREQSKKTEEVVKAISKAQAAAAKGEAPSAGSQQPGGTPNIPVTVVDEFDHRKVNKATGKGRDRGSEERNASAVNNPVGK